MYVGDLGNFFFGGKLSLLYGFLFDDEVKNGVKINEFMLLMMSLDFVWCVFF